MNNCNCKKQIYEIKKQHFKNCRITPDSFTACGIIGEACATRDIPFVLTDEGPVGIVILPPDEVDGTSRVELTISVAQPDISPDENTAEGPVGIVILPPDEVAPPEEGPVGIVILSPDEVIELTDISPEELMEQEEEETRIKNELALIQLSKLTKKKIRK